MKTGYISMILAFLCLMSALTMQAQSKGKIRLPHLLSDNMVLQSNKDVTLWGWSDAGQTIGITPSWSNERITAMADRNGKWKAQVRMPEASYTPLAITFSCGKEHVTLRNILSGEVWVCAGQSNMEMPMEGFEACPTEGYLDALVDAEKQSAIRFVKVPSRMCMTPLDDADCQWEEVNMETVGKASAVGYFFANILNRTLNVPVGLIMANKGGTRVESWLNRAYLEKHTEEALDSLDMAQQYKYSFHYPMVWGNGTFHPILNYTVKGILFYQGCSNVGDKGNQYSERLALLARQWREEFQQGVLPFYFVEIAPCTWKDLDGLERAYLREQQQRAATLIPHSALVCTNDCVYPHEWRQIHPCQKKKVGERLAFLALHYDYGKKNMMCESPQFDHMTISHDTCTVFLRNDYGALSRYEDMEGFEMAGPDKVFYKAHAIYKKGAGILLTCKKVKTPVAVRYCFHNFSLGNVANRAGLPLFPFRTDNWEE